MRETDTADRYKCKGKQKKQKCGGTRFSCISQGLKIQIRTGIRIKWIKNIGSKDERTKSLVLDCPAVNTMTFMLQDQGA